MTLIMPCDDTAPQTIFEDASLAETVIDKIEITAEQADQLLIAMESDTFADLSAAATPEVLATAVLSDERPFTAAAAAKYGLVAAVGDQLLDIAWKNGRLGCLLAMLDPNVRASHSQTLADSFVAMASCDAPLALNLYLTLKVSFLG